MTVLVELSFTLLGESLPTDHGYPLYSALSRSLDSLHNAADGISIGPIAGVYVGDGMLQLDRRRSRLRFRLPAERIPELLPLAGKSLDVAGHAIRLGVPQVRALVPAPTLMARAVTIKASDRADASNRGRYMEPGPFLAAVRKQLVELGIEGEPAIPLIHTGLRAGQPRRKIICIKDRRVVGFALIVEALSAQESIRLQEQGVGGRRKLGCGFFVPVSSRGMS